MLVPREFWPAIRHSTHIRYVRTDGKYRSGGFVQKNPMVPDRGQGRGKQFIKLQNGFYPRAQGYVTWPVAYEDLAEVYVKMDAVALANQQNVEAVVRRLNANITKMAAHVNTLESRIRNLERAAPRPGASPPAG